MLVGIGHNLYLAAYLLGLIVDCQFCWNSSFFDDFGLFRSFSSFSKIFLTLLLIPNLLALILLFQNNHIFDTICKCHAISHSCMIMHGWNVRVLNPFSFIPFFYQIRLISHSRAPHGSTFLTFFVSSAFCSWKTSRSQCFLVTSYLYLRKQRHLILSL